jgi:hypothetical protein
MAPRPWNPRIELDGALARGNLTHAISLAAEVAEDQRRPLDLATALHFLPMVAAQQPQQYDGWALRWLQRWIVETSGTTIGHAAEVACALADGAGDPLALESVRRELGRQG